jgi:hypothetical protein
VQLLSQVCEGFALIASPLHAIISKHGRNGQKVDKAADNGGRRNLPFPHSWTVECQAAFEQLKKCLVSAHVLGYPDFTKPFVLEMDASFQVWEQYCLRSRYGEIA